MAPTKDEFVTGRQLCAFVEGRGYRAVPVTNAVAAADGAPLEVVGYDLRGARGNKTFIARTGGGFSLSQAALWADGVDYATDKVEKARGSFRR